MGLYDLMTTLKEAVKKIGGLDIGDNTFDYGNYFDYDTEHKLSYYDKALDIMAENIEFITYKPNWYSTCKITEFTVKYQNCFDRFLNEVYNKQFTPEYICRENNIEKIDADTELFYDVYIMAFNELINGNFSENDYKKLFNILSEETR